MEVQDGVEGECGSFVWRGHSCPRTVCSKMACRVSTNFLLTLTYAELDKDFRRHVESAAEPANMLGGELALPVENLGHDAGHAENIQQILLLQVVRAHEFVQYIHGAACPERVMFFFEVFDQQSQEIG